MERTSNKKKVSRQRSLCRRYCAAGYAVLAFGSGVGFRILLQEVQRSGFFGGKLGGFRNFLDRSGSGHFRQQLNAAVVLEARTSRDEPAHDDVFLQAAEVVHLAGDCSFGENASGFLEARRGDERV